MNLGLALVCVVDDDDGVRDGMCNLLASAGYDTVAFASAETCLDFARLANVKLALFDVRLPGMDGFALHHALLQRGFQVAVLFVSGHADADMATRALQAGAIALLQKPVDADTLLCIVERALGTGAV
ncbi:response regulator transcription factor [Massilia sp. S19_KUP03_FR1]|uniref:response regulator transcription factor n=1 Tax=Massilia sp. S19_KUP03_FR1 TaxID=3025503 RepID=UPI002FCD168B